MISPNQANLQGGANAPQGRLSNAFFIHGGRDAAMNYPVAAGYEAFLVDEEAGMFFIKSNDVTGRVINLREFKFTEVTPKQIKEGEADLSKYATKEDFNMVLEEIKKLQGQNRGHRYNMRNNRRNKHGKPYDNESTSYAI